MRFFARVSGSHGGVAWGQQIGDAVGEVEGDAAVAFADGIDAAPDDFAGSDEGIEIGGRIAGDAGGEDLRFEQRGGEGCALQRFDGVEQGVEAAASSARTPCQWVSRRANRRGSAGSISLRNRASDLLRMRRRDFRVALFAADASGTESAFEDAGVGDEGAESGFDWRESRPKRAADFAQGERPVGAGIAADEFEDGRGDRGEEGRWGVRAELEFRGRRGSGPRLRRR